ncbi:MAG: pyruvate-formate lyase, partial [Chloroflexi bacterium]|nr:pyruvate-formate lyase [Chloroflexota bacterium]
MTEQAHPTYKERIAMLHRVKVDNNNFRIREYGTWDVDDHGLVPWTEPIPFEPIPTHSDGQAYGFRGVGMNFRRWLEVHPVYINPYSALAGAWVQYGIPGVCGGEWFRPIKERKAHQRPKGEHPKHPGNWAPEDRPKDQTLFALQTKYNHYAGSVGAANHLGPDMRIGLDLGWGGLLAKLRRFRAYNHPDDTSFYDGEEDFVLGVQAWIRRHVDVAREMAATEDNPVLKQNLLEIADMNEWLVDNPPRTLREAFQFLAWFQAVDRMWATGGALDQIDRLLQPYYDADVAAGRITDDQEVVWYIASLFFNDTHYSQIGGQGPDGTDLTCRMSFLVLEAMHQLGIPCNIALRVWDGMNMDLLRKAVENHVADGTGVSFALSKGLDEGFIRQGHPIELARMRAKVGCNWTALPGIEYPLEDVTRICLITPLMMALDELMTLPESERSLDYLWERYNAQLGFSVDLMKRAKDLHMERHARNFPEIVLNLFCHGTVER